MDGGRFASVHLALGSERYDLRVRPVVIALGAGPDAAGADVVWVADPADVDLAASPLPVGADARDADHVEALAGAGAAVVGIRSGDDGALAAAGARGLAVLVDPADVAMAATHLPPERLLVRSACPVAGTVACVDAAPGPAGWGRLTVAATAGVRVVRTAEPRSVRRVTTVVDAILAAREVPAP